MRKIFEREIIVQDKDIDELNHVNNVVYLQWVQDVASAHWNSIAPAAMQGKYSWVVLKHEIEYFSPAFLGDELIAKTWVEKSEGVRSERHVEFCNSNTRRLIVRAKTVWCLVDASTMRPMRIGADIFALFH